MLGARLVTREDQRRHVDGCLDVVQARLASHDAPAARGAAVRQFYDELGPRLEVLGQTSEGRALVLA